MVDKNELAVINQLEIVPRLDGGVDIKNFDVVYNTLQAMFDGADKIVITSDESSVEYAQSMSADLTRKQNFIKQVFDEEETRLKAMLAEIQQPRKKLTRVLEQAQNELKNGISAAMKSWRKEAILEYKRNTDAELTEDMFPDKEFSRLKTKKSIFNKVETLIDKIEEEYQKKQQDLETLEKFCNAKEQPFEVWSKYLDHHTLSQTMTFIEQAVEQIKEREHQAEEVERARIAMEQALAEEAYELEEDGEQLEEQVIELSKAYDEDLLEEELPFEKPNEWQVVLVMTDDQKEKFKEFCQINGIGVTHAQKLN